MSFQLGMARPEWTTCLTVQFFDENAQMSMPATGDAGTGILVCGELAMSQQQVNLTIIFCELEGDFSLVVAPGMSQHMGGSKRVMVPLRVA